MPRTVAIRVSMGLGGQGWRLGWPDTAAWGGAPTPVASSCAGQVVYHVLLAILGGVGATWAARRSRAYRVDRWTQARPRLALARSMAERA